MIAGQTAKRPIIVAFDFDGTLVRRAFPSIGEPMPGAFELLKELKSLGVVLILWTCREDAPGHRAFLTEAVDFCRAQGIEFDGVNETPTHLEFRPNGGRKVYADLYVDDQNFGGLIDFEGENMRAWIKALSL